MCDHERSVMLSLDQVGALLALSKTCKRKFAKISLNHVGSFLALDGLVRV